jgi:hypothetical protein
MSNIEGTIKLCDFGSATTVVMDPSNWDFAQVCGFICVANTRKFLFSLNYIYIYIYIYIVCVCRPISFSLSLTHTHTLSLSLSLSPSLFTCVSCIPSGSLSLIA